MSNAPSPSSPPGGRRWLVPALVAAFLVVAGAVAFVATRSGGGSSSGSDAALVQQREVVVDGATLAAYDSTAPSDPAVGQVAPKVQGTSFDGTPVTIGGPGTGNRLVLFVAHWCPHCQREVPLLAPKLQGLVPGGGQVLTVATGTNASAPNYPPSAWLRKVGWKAPVLADSKGFEAAKAYGLSSYPYFVALDKDGKVIARGTGELAADAVSALFRSAS